MSESNNNELNIDAFHNTLILYPTRDLINKSEARQVNQVSESEIDSTIEPLIIADFPLFSDFQERTGQYLFKDGKQKKNSSAKPKPAIRDTITEYPKNVCVGLNIDTEFITRHYKPILDTLKKDGRISPDSWKQTTRKPLTTQIKGIYKDAPSIIFGRTTEINQGRDHSHVALINSDFDPVDYLRKAGLSVQTCTATSTELKDLPKLLVIVYAHFATAEINLIADGTIKDEIKQLQRSTGDSQIISQRRAQCQQVIEGQTIDYVSLRHIITLNGYDYELCLKIVDTCALHGVASYKDLCAAVGLETPYKDLISKKEKEDILKIAIERWQDFEQYALGDLLPYDILMAFDIKWQELYTLLGLADYYRQPKLTIGGSVKDLFEAALAKKLGILNYENCPWIKGLNEGVVQPFIEPSSASVLRQHSKETRCLLAKVEGGRCRNNRPTDIFVRRKIKGKYDSVLICDLDISGCYGEGQRNQSYPIGTPEIFDYKVLKNNEYITLKEWLISYDVNIELLVKACKKDDYQAWWNTENWGELVPGLWKARISTKNQLKYPQDFFASWFQKSSHGVNMLAKTISQMKSDTEMVDTDFVEFDEHTGYLKIFNHEIHNGVITHDGLEWILAICGDRQREELLESIQVLASEVYPRSQRIVGKQAPEAYKELVDKNNNWDGINTTRRVKIGNRTQIVMTFEQCHAWFDIGLGELIIDDLLIERKRAQKKYGKKSPLDVLFKLCVNTLYGDMVSRFFVTSNPVVGNNITARARAMAWYMEKGLNGFQPITDGCGFLLNEVLSSSRDRLNGTSVNLHRKDSQLAHRNIKKVPLGGVEILGDVKTFDFKKWVGEKTVEVSEKYFAYIVGDNVYEPVLEPDDKHEDCFTVIPASTGWIDSMSMEHLQEQFSMVSVLHRETTALIVNKDLSVEYKPRKGQFSFETKDVYHSAAFHGSANYIFSSLKEDYVKARGYETNKEHWGVEIEKSEGDEITFKSSDKYDDKNNPMKDFMKQLLNNPESVTRQIPGVKQGILKIADYKNNHQKYDNQGLEAGDTLMKPVLLQEFSLSQFTFQTFEQYMLWAGMIEKLKQEDYQSFEGFFLNPDGTLNFVEMTNWVDEQIAAGVTDPFALLSDKNRNGKRTEERAIKALKGVIKKGRKAGIVTLTHPEKAIVERLKGSLKEECD